jgi:hypothetical protein
MTAHTKKRQAKSQTEQNEISIHVAQKHSFQHPLSFEGRVLATLGGHLIAWTMDMLPGTRVPIQLEQDQRLILIAHDQDLLLDSRGMHKAFPIHKREDAHNETQDIG